MEAKHGGHAHLLSQPWNFCSGCTGEEVSVFLGTVELQKVPDSLPMGGLYFSLIFVQPHIQSMNELTIDRKKYVIVSKKEYQQLQKQAARKVKHEIVFTLDEARKYSHDLIQKWGSEK